MKNARGHVSELRVIFTFSYAVFMYVWYISRHQVYKLLKLLPLLLCRSCIITVLFIPILTLIKGLKDYTRLQIPQSLELRGTSKTNRIMIKTALSSS